MKWFIANFFDNTFLYNANFCTYNVMVCTFSRISNRVVHFIIVRMQLYVFDIKVDWFSMRLSPVFNVIKLMNVLFSNSVDQQKFFLLYFVFELSKLNFIFWFYQFSITRMISSSHIHSKIHAIINNKYFKTFIQLLQLRILLMAYSINKVSL